MYPFTCLTFRLFPVFDCYKKVAMKIHVEVFVLTFFFLVGKYLGVELLECMIDFNFMRKCQLFYIVFIPFFSHTVNV